MKKVVVLGAGMIGSVISRDLSWEQDYEVTIADICEDALGKVKANKKIETICADLSNPLKIKELVSDYDLVCGAMPSRFGYQTMKAVIEAGKDYVDISFLPEDAMQLDSFAKEHDVTVVYDCGVAPGMTHMLVGYADSQCDDLIDVRIYVGGIPRQKKGLWQYKAAFAPSDVLEEYTRPVTIIENNQIVQKDALSEPENMEFPGAGILEAFQTDGLRSLIKTTKAWNMVEKTLRYPGHIDKIKVLRDSGFLGKEPIEVDGSMVVPLNLTETLLFPEWKYAENEEDMTVLRVIVDGMKNGVGIRFNWAMLDYYDTSTKVSSMARTTAFPCAIVARMVERGMFRNHGVNPPEFVGKDEGNLEFVLKELDKRGVAYMANVEKTQ